MGVLLSVCGVLNSTPHARQAGWLHSAVGSVIGGAGSNAILGWLNNRNYMPVFLKYAALQK